MLSYVRVSLRWFAISDVEEKTFPSAVLECFPAAQKDWDVVQSMPMV